MPRLISFAMTTAQFRNRTKTVTRRYGWEFLKAGDILVGVEKGQGLKKGEKVVVLGRTRVISVRQEPLCDITPQECEKEGFPDMPSWKFVEPLY